MSLPTWRGSDSDPAGVSLGYMMSATSTCYEKDDKG